MTLRPLFFVAVITALASVTVARPPDWLQPLLTVDVKALAKGSNAVRLLDSGDVHYTSTDRVRSIYRGAVRAVTNSGRSAATCGYRYDADTEKILAARAWIVSPDGKAVTEFSIRDFTDAVTKLGDVYWDRERVLGFNGAKQIQTGGAFAWEFEVESQTGIWDANWSVMSALPTYVSTFDISPPPQAKLEWHSSDKALGAPEPGATAGALHWSWRGLQPVKFADAPAGFIPRWRMVSVRAMRADGADEPRTWPALARLFAAVIEPKIEVSSEVKTKATAIVGAKSTRWERVRALTEFVQREIVYVGVKADTDYLAGFRPHTPVEVLRNRYGDCKDKAALLVALLRAIGERGCLTAVTAGNPKAIDPEWPAARFNHVIVAIQPEEPAPAGWPSVDGGALGSLVLFDPTDPHTPLGLLSEDDQGGLGLVVAGNSPGLITLPVPHSDANRHDLRVHAILDAQGNASVTATEISRGSRGVAAHVRREQQGNDQFKSELERRVHDTLAVFDHLEWTDQWDAAAMECRLEFSLDTPGYARRAGEDLLLVSPQVIWASPRLTPWKTKQNGAVWFPARYLRKEVRITPPKGGAVEELPTDLDEKIGKATCHLHYRRDGKSVVFSCELKEQAGLLDFESYEARRLLLQRLEEAERRRIVIRANSG